MNNEVMRFTPAVFMIGKDYQIMFLTKTRGIGWIEIGTERFCNEEGGLLQWDNVHKINVPGELLNKEKEYTVVFVEYEDRPAYFPKGVERIRQTYTFTPYIGGNLCIFQFADTHGDVEKALEAYQKAKPCNVLLFNGDIISSCEGIEEFEITFELISKTVGGSCPVICTRGNHDTRGRMAQDLLDYIPTDDRNGRRETFYTIRQGDLWGLVLDCGEDKVDSHAEYGGTICFEDFRNRQTKYMEEIIRNKEQEYAAEGVMYKIVFCHIPFAEIRKAPFDVAADTYDYWTKLLNDMGIDLMISGHMHKVYAIPPHAPGKRDMNFPTAVLSRPNKQAADGNTYFVGGIIEGKDGELTFDSVPGGEMEDKYE